VIHKIGETDKILQLENSSKECEIDNCIALLETNLSFLQKDLLCKIESFDRIFHLESQIQPLLQTDVAYQEECIRKLEFILKKNRKK
jgi:hypothetical protein